MLTRAKDPAGNWLTTEEVAKLPKEDRPPCLCPACDAPLIPKLGRFKAHHFAHRPESSGCYAAGGEGLEHLEAKQRLLAWLEWHVRAGSAVLGHLRCTACPIWFQGLLQQTEPGDEVRAEHWLDPERTLKPDVTIWRNNRCVAVFEVVVSHPCGEEKWSRLVEYRAPVVEIPASRVPTVPLTDEVAVAL